MCALGMWVVRWKFEPYVVGGGGCRWLNFLCGAFSGELTKHRTAPQLHNSTVFLSVSHSFNVPLSPYSFSLFISLSLSGLLLSVPPKPPYQHVWLMKKGNVQEFNYTDMLVTEREMGGGAGEKETEKGRKKQCPSETPLTEVQLALLWTKDVIILFKIMSENLR